MGERCRVQSILLCHAQRDRVDDESASTDWTENPVKELPLIDYHWITLKLNADVLASPIILPSYLSTYL